MAAPIRTPSLVLSWACFAALVSCQSAAGTKAPASPTAPATSGAIDSVEAPALSPPALIRVGRMSAATKQERDYFLYLPAGYETHQAQLWPVLMFLHGNGERGDAKADLDYLLKNGPLYEAWIQKRDLPFLIVAPQLPMYGRDAHADYLKNRTRAEIPVRLDEGVPARPARFATPDPMVGAVARDLDKSATPYGPPMGWPELELDLIGILDDVIKERRGDASRQYLTGLSYGGYGTWYMASKYPERFAAIVPVVGYGHPDVMEPIAAAKLPIWCFAGGRDGGVHPQFFYAAFNRLEALGHKDFRFTIEADMGHDVWSRTYAGKDVYDWLLQHHR